MKHVIITMRWLTTVFCVVILVIPRDCQHSFTGVNSLLKYFGKSQDGLDVNSTSSPIDGQWNTDADHHSKSDQLSSDEVLRVTDPGKGYSNSNLVRHAALPRGLAVFPMPLTGSDHELAFNVTWKPPIGPPVRGYSIEVHSVTDTVDCHSSMCYEYDIPGDSLWSVIPTAVSPVPEGCAVRPGCAYQLKVIAHPWDGHTAAYINVELDECVAGVCSCAHAPRLPRPDVVAEMVVIGGELFVNVTWSLPPPPEPLRLPPRLRKQYYFVSIGKKMVSDAHPAPWYAHAVSRRADAFGFVSVPEDVRWLMLPISERSGDRSGDRSGERNRDLSGERSRDRSGERSRDRSRERSRDRSGERSRDDKQSIILDVKLLARVTLVDERGCVGPVGNATAYDPSKTATTPLKTFMIWAIVCGACVLMMIVLVAFSARVVKRVLREFRPASSDPLQPLGVRPAWFQFGT